MGARRLGEVHSAMAEFNSNIWAPWRMQYIDSLAGRDEQGCFLCQLGGTPKDDAQNHVLWRSDQTLVLLNRFPYSSGHLLVATAAHEAQLEALPEDVLLELMLRVRDAKRVLEVALNAQGFNVGLNIGTEAGAGLPGHLHFHIVPRWQADTNYMPVLADVKVIPQALEESRRLLAEALEETG